MHGCFYVRFFFDDILIAFLVAGHDTTSTALQWLVFELAKKPNIQHQMREEINKLFEPNAHLTYENTKQLVFTKNVINENLRLVRSVLHF